MRVIKKYYYYFVLSGLRLERKYALRFWYENRFTDSEKYCETVIDKLDIRINEILKQLEP